MLTVVFASHNGGAVLRNTLEAFTKLKSPTDGWRLIAVDNNSTDETKAILESFSEKLPITVLKEARQGKNFALNQAVELVDNGLVVFTDDDVLPNEEWLQRIEEAANDNPEYDLFGGAIIPKWPQQPPAWLAHTTNIGMLYAATPETAEGPVPAGAIWGPNMAVRATALKESGGFDTATGPDGSSKYIMGSETELLNRMERKGHKAWFVPSAAVGHQIRPWQLERQWVLQRYFRHGRACYAHDHHRNTNDVFILGAERWLWKRYAMAWLCFFCSFFSGNEQKKIQSREQVKFSQGEVFQSRLCDVKKAELA